MSLDNGSSTQAYSNEKALWHLDKIAALRRGGQIVPAQIQCVISDLCNEHCAWCSYRRDDGFSSEAFGVYGDDGHLNMNPNRMIPTDKVKEILQDCAQIGVKAIQFTGGGEPTVHPEAIGIFRYAQSLALETSLVSNGVLLKPGWDEVYPRMAWVRISIDAGTRDTYAKLRDVKPVLYDQAIRHLADIRAAIDRMQSACLLGAGYVITLDNWHELYEGTKRLKDAGAQNVRLSAMFSKAGDAYYGEAVPAIEGEILKTLRLQDEHFRVINMFGDRIADLQQHAPDYGFCGYQQFNMYIGGNLKVYRCCSTAYTHHGEVGDLSSQRFIDWFHSEQKHRAYDTFNARSCQVCQFNGKNRAILYAIDPAPVHVNFV